MIDWLVFQTVLHLVHMMANSHIMKFTNCSTSTLSIFCFYVVFYHFLVSEPRFEISSVTSLVVCTIPRTGPSCMTPQYLLVGSVR